MTRKKLLFPIGLMVVLVLMVCGSPAAVADGLLFGATYRSETVNLRSQPTVNSTRLGTYDKDTWVRIDGESGNWYMVTTPDQRQGYMSKNYVDVTQEYKGTIGLVTNQNANAFLNLRQYPSYDAPVLGIYYNGAPCIILSQNDGWANVMVDGVMGYFRTEFIRRSYQVYSSDAATVVTPGLTGLNLRTGPGKEYDSYGLVAGGSYVMILQRAGDWCKVVANNQVGYVDASFLVDDILTPQEAARQGSKKQGTTTSYAIVTNPKSTQVLNLREEPNTTSKSLATFRNGTRMTVLEQGVVWCRVMTVDGLSGYMMSKYLTLINLPAAPAKTVQHPKGTYVNLRTLSSMNGPILRRLQSGTVVTVLAPGSEWVQVNVQNTVGYIRAEFLE